VPAGLVAVEGDDDAAVGEWYGLLAGRDLGMVTPDALAHQTTRPTRSSEAGTYAGSGGLLPGIPCIIPSDSVPIATCSAVVLRPGLQEQLGCLQGVEHEVRDHLKGVLEDHFKRHRQRVLIDVE